MPGPRHSVEQIIAKLREVETPCTWEPSTDNVGAGAGQ
jgi:hypothetical protein